MSQESPRISTGNAGLGGVPRGRRRHPVALFRIGGPRQQAISIGKNRNGSHEDTMREFRIDAMGIRLGEAHAPFRGVLTGTPEHTGSTNPSMEDRAHRG